MRLEGKHALAVLCIMEGEHECQCVILADVSKIEYVNERSVDLMTGSFQSFHVHIRVFALLHACSEINRMNLKPLRLSRSQ